VSVVESSGIYRYWRGGEDQGIVEAWRRIRHADGTLETEVTRDAPAFGAWIGVHTWQHSVGTDFQRVEVIWRSTNPGAVADRRAIYTFSPLTVQIDDSTPFRPDTPPHYITAPLMRIFISPTIRQLAAQGGRGQVLIPDITTPTSAERLLLPLFEERTVTFLRHETLPEYPAIAAEVYSYTSQNYDAEAQFWLVDNVLLRYCFGDWDIHLTDW
jgi:hypothetical protein